MQPPAIVAANKCVYGTRLLALALKQAKSIGLREVLVTCDRENRSSARINEHNGGQLENQVISRNTGSLIARYWIKLE